MSIPYFKSALIAAALIVCITVIEVVSTTVAMACPFCSAINLTFTEQLKSNDIVVIAELLHVPKPSDDPDAELPKAEFQIKQVLKGERWVDQDMKFKTLLVGHYPVGQRFLVMGVDPPTITWSDTMKASDRVIKYLQKLPDLPAAGPKRLAFFQNHFEDEESVLAFDAYDEFARAPYEDLIALKDQMDHEQIIKWIKDPEISVNRRRLYFVMLGVCGNKKEDVKMLEGFIKSGDRKQQAGLDALLACYLNLTGSDGVSLVEETFLKDKTVEYVDTLAAVSALRFHGTEVEIVSKDRIVKAIRHLLDRPKMADMIIPDLARWEDWTVMERLVQMFKDADEETNWLRVPVITYLRACPKPEAKKYIEELRKIDPDAIRRADFFLDFSDGFGDEETDEDDEDGKNKDEGDGEPLVASPVGAPAQHVVKKPAVDLSADATETAEINMTDDEKTVFVSSGAPGNNTNSASPVVPATTITSPIIATPVASSSGVLLTIKMLLIPLAVSLVLLVLIWSVLSGSFERLIF